jgi:hypothetical protein
VLFKVSGARYRRDNEVALSDPSTTRRLAELIVEALELGTGKYENDVATDLFDAFDLDLAQLEKRIPRTTRRRKSALRQLAAAELASAAPSAGALMTEAVRCGGRFVDMVEEIYAVLAEHLATTAGSSEPVRIKREDLAFEITISPAFIQRLRELHRGIRRVTLVQVDEASIGRFLSPDGGEFYGRWPLGDRDSGQADEIPIGPFVSRRGGELYGSPIGDPDGFRLADAVLHLGWLGADASSTDPQIVHEAHAAAKRLITTAERLVEAHMARLIDVDSDEIDEIFTDLDEWSRRYAAAELERFRAEGLLAAPASRDLIAGIDDDSLVGLVQQQSGDGRVHPTVIPSRDHARGTAMSSLAQFVAMWRLGLHAKRSRSDVEMILASGPAAFEEWLSLVQRYCDQAEQWLRDDAVVPIGYVDLEELVERFEEYLDLPLWRGRQLLYEVWILCATLQACRDAGWTTKLRCLEHEGDVWNLTTKPTTTPVADLCFNDDNNVTLHVWREPRRVTGSGVVTPDVTVSTPGDHPRDLVVIEAKDRYNMRAEAAADDRSALGVATKYRAALRPITTWVCNHCDFRDGDIDPAANRGDVWSRVHLAAAFRPGAIPAAFAESLEAALTPPGGARPTAIDRLLLAIDVTSSMVSSLPDVWAKLNGVDARSLLDFWAVLYCDHGQTDPFVVRDVGPCPDLATLVKEIAAEPFGGGGDEPEALEDAMHRCRTLATSLGPLTVLVLTDAPPHPQDECPLGIDFWAEVSGLLATGSRCLVATDWQHPDDSTWDTFTTAANFERHPLSELLEHLGDDASVT